MLALPSLCFYSCLEGELPHPRRHAWVLWGAAGSRVPHGLCGCCAHWLDIVVTVHGLSGKISLPQSCLRAVFIWILMEDTTWLWAESKGVSARAHPRDLPCFGVSLAGLGA